MRGRTGLELSFNTQAPTLPYGKDFRSRTRTLVQKKLYLGRDSGVERMRPFLVAEKLRDAAIKKLQLGYGGSWGEVWEQVDEEDSGYEPHPQIHVQDG